MKITLYNYNWCKRRIRMLDWYHVPYSRYVILYKVCSTDSLQINVADEKYYKQYPTHYRGFDALVSLYFTDGFPSRQQIINKYEKLCIKRN